jgi:hypothetical protein
VRDRDEVLSSRLYRRCGVKINVETAHQLENKNSFDLKGLYQSKEIFSFNAEDLGGRGAIAVSGRKCLRD